MWLLGKDKTLATREATIREGESGQTCLQLLAKMPTAFWSTSRMGTMKKFLYVCTALQLISHVLFHHYYFFNKNEITSLNLTKIYLKFLILLSFN